jgi:predicted regulator of Ras-like GTPase activity (Roadblock/LC7/MglB family)
VTVVSSDEFSLEQILREMNEEGHFKASVLISAEGLSLSSASSPFDTETISAMVALLRNTVEQARMSIGLDEVDEVSIVQADKMRLICRCFVLGEEELILSIIAPPHQTYRRLTNQAISRIRQAWQGLPGGRGR